MFPPVVVLCQLYSKVLSADNSLKGLVVEDEAGGDPLPFPDQLVTFPTLKDISHLIFQDSSVLRSSCGGLRWSRWGS